MNNYFFFGLFINISVTFTDICNKLIKSSSWAYILKLLWWDYVKTHFWFWHTIFSSILKKASWHGRLSKLAKQTKASATSMFSNKIAAMKDMPWTYERGEKNKLYNLLTSVPQVQIVCLNLGNLNNNNNKL